MEKQETPANGITPEFGVVDKIYYLAHLRSGGIWMFETAEERNAFVAANDCEESGLV